MAWEYVPKRGAMFRQMQRAGYTLREIMAATGMASTSTVVYAIKAAGHESRVARPPLRVRPNRDGTYEWLNRMECISYCISEEESE